MKRAESQSLYSALRSSVVKPKTKVLQRPIRTKAKTARSQLEFKVNIRNRPQARENARNQVEIGFSLASDWSRWRRVSKANDETQ